MRQFPWMVAALAAASLPAHASTLDYFRAFVTQYEVSPPTAVADRPGVCRWQWRQLSIVCTSGQFTSSRQFQVRFGLYNFSADTTYVDRILFDFVETDGLDNDFLRSFEWNPTPDFSLPPTRDWEVYVHFSMIDGVITDFDVSGNPPTPRWTPWFTVPVSAAQLNLATDPAADRRTLEFTGAGSYFTRAFGSVENIDVRWHLADVPEPGGMLLAGAALTLFAIAAPKREP